MPYFCRNNNKHLQQMNTIMIDSGVYNVAQRYARAHNVSVEKLVEEIIIEVVSAKPPKDKPKAPYMESAAYKEALALMDSFVADDLATPVPADEDASAALVENKYAVI